MLEQFNWLIYPGLMVVGVILHIVKKVMQVRNNQNRNFTLKGYFVTYPYRTVLTFGAGFIGYLTLVMDGSLGYVSAVMAGIAANSLGDVAGSTIPEDKAAG